MNASKQSTQWITSLIFCLTVALGIPFVLTKIGQALGLWSSIDSPYITNPLLFWILLVVTRVLFAAVWILITVGLYRIGGDWVSFWFELERGPNFPRRDPVDHSDLSFGIFRMIVLAMLAEVAIRVVTLTNSPYLPPAN